MSWLPVLQMGGGMSGAWSVAFLGPFVGLLIMLLLVYLLWNVLTGSQPSAERSGRSTDAMETLRERYARGEIDAETFEKRAQRLRDQ